LLASANVNVWEGNYKNALASLKAIPLGDKQSRMKGGDAIVEAIKSPETYIFALLGRPRNVRSIPAPRIIKKYRIKIKYTSKLPRAGSIAEPNSIFYDRRTKTVKVTDAKGKVFNAGKLDKLSKTGVSKIREALRKESVKAKKTAKKIKKTINDKKIIEKYGLNPEKLSKELNLKAIENQLSFLRKQADNLKISEIQAKKLGFSGLKELKKYQNTTNKNVIKKINKRVSNRLQKRYEKAVMDLKRKRETANKKRTKTKQKNKIKKEKEVDTSIQQKVEKELGKIKKKELEKIIKENNQAKKQGFKDAVEKRKFLRDSKLAQKGNILAKIRLKLLEKKFKNRKSSKAKNIQKRIKSALNKAEQVFVVRKKSRINKDVAKRLKKVDNRIQKTALQVAPIEYNIKRKIEATRKVNKLGFKNLNEFKRYAKVAEYAKRGDKKALNLIDKLENKRFNNLSKSKGKKVVKKESKELLKSLRDKGAVRERSDKLKQQILKDLKNKEKKPIIIQKGNERVIIKKNKIIKQINIKKPIKSGNTILIQEKWVETKTIKVKPKQKVKQKQKAKQVLKQKSKTIKKRKIATINKRQIKSLSKLNLFKKLRSLLVFKPISKNKINIISKQKIDAKTKNDIKQILDIALKRKTKTKPKQKPKQKQKPKTKTPIPQKTITKTPRTPRTPRTPQIPKIPKRPIIKIPKIKIKKKKGKKIPRGKMQGYVALVRAKGRRINGKYIRGRLVRVSKSLPRNKALKLAGELADKTTSQTIKVIEGNIIKKRKDIKRPKILRKYKKSKSFKNALREKAKARIDTRGEKRGLSLRKALLQRKKKREKAKRRKKRAKKN